MDRVEDIPLLPWGSRRKRLNFPIHCIVYRIIDDSELEYRPWLFIFTKQISFNNSYTYWLLLKYNRSSHLRHIPAERTSHLLSGAEDWYSASLKLIVCLIWLDIGDGPRGVISGDSREVREKSLFEWFSRGIVVIKQPQF